MRTSLSIFAPLTPRALRRRRIAGCVKIIAWSARAIAISVMPQACGAFDGERGRRGKRDQRRRAEYRRLGDHFERAAAGDDEEAVVGGDAASDERADQLVERIVPPDILAQRDDRAVAIAPGGAMDRAGFAR